MNDINALYAALLEALGNAGLLAQEIDAEFGTTLSAQLSLTLPAIPPVVGAPPAGGPVYVNGATAPDADGMVVIKSVEDFRTQYANDKQASVRNLAAGLPNRWFIQDTLDGTAVSDAIRFQVQTQTNAARTMLGLLGGNRTSYYQPVFHATQSAKGLYTQGALIEGGGAFAGDFVIAGITVWKGVRVADVPVVLAAQLSRAQKNNTVNNA